MATKTRPTRKGRPALYVFDAVVLSNFALASRLDVMVAGYKGVGGITTEVLDEIAQGVATGYEQLGAVVEMVGRGRLRQVTLTQDERQLYTSLRRGLGSGEASCVAVVKSRGGVVATDDRAARARCASMGIDVTGTVGILKAACMRGRLSAAQADHILMSMIASGFYAPVRSISDLL